MSGRTGRISIPAVVVALLAVVAVAGAQTAPSLRVLAPNGGETLQAGSAVMIRWSSAGNVGAAVRLEYSLNDGADWVTIHSRAANSGACPWVLPLADSALCRVRVTALADPAVTDSSDRPFRVAPIGGAAVAAIPAADTTPPLITGQFPADGAFNVPRDTLIQFHLIDAESGVDATTITVAVFADGVAVAGSLATAGSAADTLVVAQPTLAFDYGQTISVHVGASDADGNAMPTAIFSFTTEVRSFGANQRVDAGAVGNDHAAIVADPSLGSLFTSMWVAWDRVVNGQGQILLASGTGGVFGAEIAVSQPLTDNRRPSLGISALRTLFLVWEQYDILGRSTVVGVSGSAAAPSALSPLTDLLSALPGSVTELSRPAVALVGNDLYLACLATVGGVKQLLIAKLPAGADWTALAITNATADQADPVIAVASDNTVYAAWTNTLDRNIYASSSAAWTLPKAVTNSGTASAPALATETSGNVLHFLWVSTDGTGASDILYARTLGGLPASPLTGVSVLDGPTTSIRDAAAPRLVVQGSGAAARVFACWQDRRSVVAGDTDIQFAETTNPSDFGINQPPNDDGTTRAQTGPAIALDPTLGIAMVWTDRRDGDAHIFYSEPTRTARFGSAWIVGAAGGTRSFSTPLQPAVTGVTLTIPAGVLPTTRTLTVNMVFNPRVALPGATGNFISIGPSTDDTLSSPVTVTVFNVNSSVQVYAYRYVPPATLLGQGTWTHASIGSDIFSATQHSLTFTTTHLSTFGLSTVPPALMPDGGGGGGGGGCALVRGGPPDLVLLLLPALALGIALGRRLRNRARLTGGRGG